ncbi:MAG: signal peptidase II [Pirellulaceae bacterium]|nr:signal peptidase II [Pirellulaceae bacterium]
MKQSRVLAQWFTFTALAAGGAALDLWSKAAVFAWRGTPGVSFEPYWLIEGWVGIETAVNEGALFGMGAGFGTMFAALSVAAGLGILVWLAWFGAIESWWLSIALGCIMAGIFGNLYDRLGLWWQSDYPPEWRSGVRDWILLRYKTYTWPNFNVADSLLVAGAIMLAIHSFTAPIEQPPTEGSKN